MSVYCTNCGMYFEENVQVCPNCGTNLDELEFETKRKFIRVREMSFENAIIAFWEGYFNFQGRSRRREFWYAAICNWLIALAISILGAITIRQLASVMEFMFTAMVVLPNLAVAIRRMHDIGKSGFILLVSFIPVIGPIWLLILLARDSEKDANIYGESPKYYYE
ncbi:MAG: DUF805 domain-containing protein [Clostridia bacterium]|nr:DUF805 domain-containing protein [Clostridia bacterium]